MVNEYTQKDIDVLFEAVDWTHDNVNSFAMQYKISDKGLTGVPIRGGTPRMMLEHDIQFLFKDDQRQEALRFILTTPIEDVPFYVNRSDKFKTLVEWRLKIGK